MQTLLLELSEIMTNMQKECLTSFGRNSKVMTTNICHEKEVENLTAEAPHKLQKFLQISLVTLRQCVNIFQSSPQTWLPFYAQAKPNGVSYIVYPF